MSDRWWEQLEAADGDPELDSGAFDCADVADDSTTAERFAAFAPLLTHRQWQVVWLCYGIGLTQRQAAARLRISRCTIRRHRRLAITKLRFATTGLKAP